MCLIVGLAYGDDGVNNLHNCAISFVEYPVISLKPNTPSCVDEEAIKVPSLFLRPSLFYRLPTTLAYISPLNREDKGIWSPDFCQMDLQTFRKRAIHEEVNGCLWLHTTEWVDVAVVLATKMKLVSCEDLHVDHKPTKEFTFVFYFGLPKEI
jgi:hypothetical protein